MRKSKIYLFISILCLLVLFCFILKLPNAIFSNLLIIISIVLGISSFLLYCYNKNIEFINEADENINNLKEKYSYVNQIVHVHTHLIFNDISDDVIKKYHVQIYNFDDYLTDLENNIQILKDDSKTNSFVSIACVMDSLIAKSAWKIQSSIPQEVALVEDLVFLNCKLAVCVALSLCNLSYEALKDNEYIKRLIKLLMSCYYEENYGIISTIQYEAMILELLYNDIVKSDISNN